MPSRLPRVPIKLCTALFATLLAILSATQSAAQVRSPYDPRDLSGVWQPFAGAVASAPDADLGPEGEILIADFNARYPNPVAPGAWCVPAGMPAAMTSGLPIEIVHSYNRITLLVGMEASRRVYLDERAAADTRSATRMGHSTGRWDNDTLVIETRLLAAMLAGGWPHTEDAVIVERMTKMRRDQVSATPDAASANTPIDDYVLAIDLTLSDPLLYREPQSLTVYYQHVGDASLPESNCATELWQQALDAANP